MAEISKLNVSGVQYDVKDTAARNDIASIKEGSINLDQLVTTGSAEIGTDLTVKGNIIQQGETYETHAEKLYTKKDLIITRDGAESALTDGEYTGIQATKYDGITDGQLVFDKNGVARVGDIGYTQPLATRQDSPAANGVAYWNSDQSTFLTANPSFTIIADGAMSVAKTGTIGNLTGYVNGMSVKVLFPNGHYGSSFTLKLDNLTAKTIYVPSNGSVKEMESKSLDREDGNGTQPWYVQPFTTLELMYVESLGGGAGGWLVTGNPVVLSSSTSGYTIYADGSTGPDIVGTINTLVTTTIPYGWLLCDGTEYDIASYSLLAIILLELPFNAGVTDGKFRVPDLRSRFIQGASENLGEMIEAGLPNIKGSFGSMPGRNANNFADGAFTQKHNGSYSSCNDIDSYLVTFEASAGETKTDGTLKTDEDYKVYGKSDTVQPPAFTVNYIIKY